MPSGRAEALQQRAFVGRRDLQEPKPRPEEL